ncbi:MAG: DUF4097 family beta strand repeat-containing protein [Candidatus Acidiferrales bacterium]
MSNGTAYRRGSVFGGLLLIAIGGLFLYANLHREFSPWPLIATYWPVLIIFWGLSRLVDYLILRGTPEAAAVTRLGAGDIIGLIFLVLFGSMFSQAYNRGWWKGGPFINIGGEEMGCIFGSEYEFSDDASHAVGPSPRLELANGRGAVTVTTATGAEVRLKARKQVCAQSEEQGKEMAAKMIPVFEQTGNGLEFHWDTPTGSTGLLRAALDVEVPRGVNLKVETRGDVKIIDHQGALEVNSEHGDVELRKIDGPIDLKMRHGSARVTDVRGEVKMDGRGDEVDISNVRGAVSLEGEYYGPIRLAAIAGPLRFVSRRTNVEAARLEGDLSLDSGELTLRGVPGDVVVQTKDKEIQVEQVSGQLRIENRNGRVVIRASKPPTNSIQVENERGSIELYLPAASGFQLRATARKGDVESDFAGLSSGRDRDRGPDETLTGTVGDGRALIHLSTTYGTISIRRGS